MFWQNRGKRQQLTNNEVQTSPRPNSEYADEGAKRRKVASREKLPRYREKLPKIELTSDSLSSDVIYAVERAERLQAKYDEESIYAALEASLPASIVRQYNRRGNLTLDEFCGTLRSVYNDPTLLHEEERKILMFEVDRAEKLSEQIMLFVRKVEDFNVRCNLAGEEFSGLTWSANRILDHVNQKLIPTDMRHYRADFAMVRQNLVRFKPLSTWGISDVQDVLSQVEFRNSFLKESLGVLSTRNTPQPNMKPCWRCGTLREVSGAFYCPCNASPTCGHCGLKHLTKYHDLANRMFSNSRNRRNLREPLVGKIIQNLKALIAQPGDPSSKDLSRTFDLFQQFISSQRSQEGRQIYQAEKSINYDSKKLALIQYGEDGDWDAVEVIIEGRKQQVLLDTGAEFSVLSLIFYDKYVKSKQYPELPCGTAVAANNGSLDVRFAVWIPILIDSYIVEVLFRVVASVSVNMLFGNNILSKATLYGKERVLLLPVSEKQTVKLQIFKWKRETDMPMTKISKEIWVLSGEPLVEHDMKFWGKLQDSEDNSNDPLVSELLDDIKSIQEDRLKQSSDLTGRKEIERQSSFLVQLVKKYPRLFDNKFRAGILKVEPQRLSFKNEEDKKVPRVTRMKHLSHKELDIVRTWLNDALKKKIIEQSESSWRSCIFPVHKPPSFKDGKLHEQFRIVTPYFNLNNLLLLRANQLPTIEDIQGELAGSKWFSTLDLREAFFQIPLHEDDRQFTAFGCSGSQLYHYRVIPMGCSVSGNILQSSLVSVLESFHFRGAIVYMDDVLVYSSGSEKDHMMLLDKVVATLERFDARVKIQKVRVCVPQILFLGMKVSGSGWDLSQKFMNAVKNAKLPSTVRQLRSFLGLLNWQRRFVPNYTEKAEPLLQLTKKGSNIVKEWSREHTEAFNLLKECILQAPTLMHPNYDIGFTIYSDASDVGLGGCLVQGSLDDQLIGFYSRKLSKEERNYSIPERELLAMICALEHFRIFIFGYKVTCKVDQKGIPGMLRLEHPSKYTRYRDRLSIFSPTVQYIKGKKNFADWFSRFAAMDKPFQTPKDKDAITLKDFPTCLSLEKATFIQLDEMVSFISWKEVNEDVRSSLWYLSWKEANRMEKETFSYKLFTFQTALVKDIDDRITYRDLQVLTEELGAILIRQLHFHGRSLAHQGVSRTFFYIRSKYFWVNMQKSIRDVLAECNICKRAKKLRIRGNRRALPMPERNMQHVHMDIFGSGALTKQRGFTAVLTVTDRKSGWTQFFPLKTKKSNEIIHILLNQWCCIFGFPELLHGDNDPAFLSQATQDFCSKYGIVFTSSGSYDHAQNGQAEQRNQFLSQQLLVLTQTESPCCWPDVLGLVSWRYNVNYNRRTNSIPFYDLYGFLPSLEDFEQRRPTLCASMKLFPSFDCSFDTAGLLLVQQEKRMPFESDLVWWMPKRKSHKFSLPGGPYTVTQLQGSSVVWITGLYHSGKHKASVHDLAWFF